MVATKLMAIKLVLGIALMNVILQAQGSLAPDALPPWISSIASLTLQTGMGVVIVVLWRAYQAKDALLVESTKAVTGALAGSASSNTELRQIIKESVDANRGLKESIDRLRAIIERKS